MSRSPAARPSSLPPRHSTPIYVRICSTALMLLLLITRCAYGAHSEELLLRPSGGEDEKTQGSLSAERWKGEWFVIGKR